MGIERTSNLAVSLLLAWLIHSVPVAWAGETEVPGEPGAEEPAKRQSSRRAATSVTVVASRTNTENAGATVVVLDREDIRRLPVRSVPELLKWVPGVDVQQRGVEGIQADISLRGADYNGTLILVDGEPVNDPQTNHHSANLDVPLDAVERVEVLYGSASSLYGSGAVGGTINIVTRGASLARARAQIEGRYAHGSNSLDSGGVRLGGRFSDRFSMAADWGRSESRGFQDGTEFDSTTLRLTSRLDLEPGPLTLSLGYAGRRFGAYGFYGTRFPYQQETTRARTGRLGGELTFGAWTISPSVAARDHHDDFVLDRNRPEFYENLHDTLVWTERVTARRTVFGGVLVAGLEASQEEIESSNLGDHDRQRQAVFFEFDRALSTRTQARLGLRWDSFSDYDSRLSPQFSIAHSLGGGFRLRASAGTAFRIPTFTELYYRDPGTQGNEELSAEKSWTVEAGGRFEKGKLFVDLAVFYRESQDLIDYVRFEPGGTFYARNIRNAEFTGIELSVGSTFSSSAPFRVTRISAHGTYLFFDLADLAREAGGAVEGRYVLDPLEYKFDLAVAGFFPLEVSFLARTTYFERPSSGSPGPLFDARIARQLLEGQIIELFVEGRNLSDRTYEERPGVPLPGRTFSGGFHITW